ncbi:MAG: hypothetical protein PVG99_05540 [Desulfobacteraceae bacterium]|jgi:hypothetical protein
MVWLVEKKVVYHVLDLGYERVEIPIRVKFEFEVKEGAFVPESLSVHTLYNRKLLEKHYPRLKLDALESAISKTVEREISQHLKECGFLRENLD